MRNKKAEIASDIFRLNPTEKAVFSLLNDEAYSTTRYEVQGLKLSEIAVLLKLARMTCHDAVQSLVQRRLVLEQKIKKNKFYSLVDVDYIIDELRDLYSHHGRKKVSLKESSFSVQKQISVYSGIENCHMIWRKIADLSRDQKFICIQPNSSIRFALTKLGIDSLYPNNDALNTRGIIVEGIVHTTCYEEIFKLLQKEKGFDFAIHELEKMGQRTANVTLIDPSYLQQPTEMIFINNIAYIINWKDEVAIEVQNKIMYDFLKEFYVLIQGYGQKINQAEYVKGLIRRLKNR